MFENMLSPITKVRDVYRNKNRNIKSTSGKVCEGLEHPFL